MAQVPSEMQWVGPAIPEDWTDQTMYRPVLVQKSFTLDAVPEQAFVMMSAIGWYRLLVNGQRVGNHELAPGWTEYQKRINYQRYDVTKQLVAGENVFTIELADGWGCGRIGLVHINGPKLRGFYTQRPRVCLALHTQTNSTETALVTDDSWQVADHPAVSVACMMDGEHRISSSTSASDWQPVVVDDSIQPEFMAQTSPPIRLTQTLPAQTVNELRPSVHIFDLGQEIAGWVRLSTDQPSDHSSDPPTEITLRHGEMLLPNGELFTENLRCPPVSDLGAKQEDTWTIQQQGRATFEPAFTYHGFRYVEVTGLPSPPKAEDMVGCAVHTDCPRILSVNTSSDTLNRLTEAVDWTFRNNLHSTPTDCPQRDERLGWTGDAKVFAQTAC